MLLPSAGMGSPRLKVPQKLVANKSWLALLLCSALSLTGDQPDQTVILIADDSRRGVDQDAQKARTAVMPTASHTG